MNKKTLPYGGVFFDLDPMAFLLIYYWIKKWQSFIQLENNE
ncbi:hypothetical protein TMUPMC115_0568 [Tetragenococcus muriaticus PMC-11-5]|uniref:Uncharacterized protein n=2 Tax=Tetragenococcus muriaticus TaxID=64642 RepID=A0A091CDV1_9ENTE|nr:hypothetical protein TMU3MR103_0468 [Tetragenococcus muriaticus 3MR10-3]KFN93228.1 hypothetical protein TMUPMC115_0568 [Tetragenococcus muriaticus PMC-11-5]